MMIKTKIWILFSFFSYCSIAQNKLKTIRINRTIIIDNRLCLKRNHTPLEGLYKIKDHKWKIELSFFKNGLREDSSFFFVYNRLSEKGMYRNNLRQGKWYYLYFDGTIETTTNYKDDKLHGVKTHYYSSGKIISEIYYEKGVKTQAYYYQNKGEIEQQCNYLNGNNYCVKFKNIESNNNKYKIIDSVFYKNEDSPFLLNSYVNDSLMFSVKVSDTIKDVVHTDKFDIVDTIKVCLFEQKKLKLSYLFPKRNSIFYEDGYKRKMMIYHIFTSYKCYYSDNSKGIEYQWDKPCNIYSLLRTEFLIQYSNGDLYKPRYYKGGDDYDGGCGLEKYRK